jgi:hypothetical protein
MTRFPPPTVSDAIVSAITVTTVFPPAYATSDTTYAPFETAAQFSRVAACPVFWGREEAIVMIVLRVQDAFAPVGGICQPTNGRVRHACRGHGSAGRTAGRRRAAGTAHDRRGRSDVRRRSPLAEPGRLTGPGRGRVHPWGCHGYSRTRTPAASKTTGKVPPVTPMSWPKSSRHSSGLLRPPAVLAA